MKKEKKQALIIFIIALVIVALYLLSDRFFKLEPVTPHYEKYDQSGRLSKIRQGLEKKK